MPKTGLGMKVATRPYWAAMPLTVYLNVIALSAVCMRVFITEVDFVLADRHFVVGHLDVDLSACRALRNIAAYLLGFVAGRKIEVTADVVRDGARAIGVEQEKFQFRPGVVNKTHFGGVRYRALERVARDRLRTACHRDYTHRR